MEAITHFVVQLYTIAFVRGKGLFITREARKRRQILNAKAQRRGVAESRGNETMGRERYSARVCKLWHNEE